MKFAQLDTGDLYGFSTATESNDWQDMQTEITGSLILKQISRAHSNEKLIRFFRKLYKNASSSQLKKIIQKTPVVLGRNITEKKSRAIIAQLRKLGAVAVFKPHLADRKLKTAPEPEVTGSDLEQTILKSFSGSLPRRRIPLHYIFGLILTAGAMILLPLLYIAITGSTAAGVLWWAMEGLAMFQRVGPRAAMVIYISPLIIGCLLVFFLIKPLLARRANYLKPQLLSRTDEPFLFSFVSRIAESVGAPPPSTIAVDTQVNASASYRRGLRSIRSRDLQLTIGLPLAAGLNINQLAGVLAHEFGHFAQAKGMMLTYVIRSINIWFYRVVYHEDAWDDRLRRWSKEIDLRLSFILYIARLFIWLSRRLLWLLMQIGEAISCFMMRQMEYDADHCEVLMAGPIVFASTFHRIAELSISYSQSFQDLQSAWQEGHLADSIPALVAANATQIPERVRRQLFKDQIEGSKTGWFDTHPSDRDRIERVRTLKVSPIFNLTIQSGSGRTESPDSDDLLPATIVFQNFHSLSQAVSLDYYRKMIGERIRPENLVPAEALLKNQGHTDAAYRALNRFLLESYSADRPIGLHVPGTGKRFDPKTGFAELKRCRELIQRMAPAYRKQLKQHRKLENRIIQLSQAQMLTQAGFSIEADAFDLENKDPQAIVEAIRRAKKERAYFLEKMAKWEKIVCSRIITAVQFLNLPAMKDRMPEVDTAFLKKEVNSLLNLAQLLEMQHEPLKHVVLTYHELTILAHQLEAVQEENKDFEVAFNGRLHHVAKTLTALRSPLAEIAYPFDHARQGLSVGEFLIASLPGNEDLSLVLDTAYQAIDRYYQLVARCFARLCHAAEAVESALSLPPLLGKAEPLAAVPQHTRPARAESSAGKKTDTNLARLIAATRKNFGNPPRKLSGRPLKRLKIPKGKLVQATGSDCAGIYFKEQEKLLVEGQLVWVHLVMANVKLFELDKKDYPAVVVYSQDSAFDGDLESLEKIATSVYTLKESDVEDPELLEFAQLMADEYKYFFNQLVPSELTDGKSVFCTVLPVHRKHLPDDYLAASWFPLLVMPYQCQNVMILPVEFWDQSLVEYWRSGCKL